jgi:hypothetical protein
MQAQTLAVAAEQPERLHLRVAWLCGVVLFLEGYDIAAVGYAIPSLVDAWRVAPSAFTQVLTAGNIGPRVAWRGIARRSAGAQAGAAFLCGGVRLLFFALGLCRFAPADGEPAISDRIGPWRRHPGRDGAGARAARVRLH